MSAPKSLAARITWLIAVGIGVFVLMMVVGPALENLLGGTGITIGIGLFLGAVVWAVVHARSSEIKAAAQRTQESAQTGIVSMLRIILAKEGSWILFRHGTFIVLAQPEADLQAQAISFLRRYGPVAVGSESADMNPLQLKLYPGWIVTYYRAEMMTYVPSSDLRDRPENSLSAAFAGRAKRQQDAEELEIIHVEDKR